MTTRYDYCKPGLSFGQYRITTSHTLANLDGEPVTVEEGEFPFEVAPPQRPLPRPQVIACYPPPGDRKASPAYRPHIVLSSAALPWSDAAFCRTGESPPPDPLPFLALVTLRGSPDGLEGPDDAGPPPALVYDTTKELVLRLSPSGANVLTFTNSFLTRLGIGDGSVEDGRLTLNNLHLHAHVVQLTGADRQRDADRDGLAAVLIGFRPWTPLSGDCTSLLIDIRPLANLSSADDTSSVDFPVFSHWSYRVDPAGLTFRQIAENLQVALFSPTDRRRACVTTDRAGQSFPDDRYLSPLRTRPGNPALDEPREGEPQSRVAVASQLLQRDPETAPADISLPASFDLGRQLALADPELLDALHRLERRTIYEDPFAPPFEPIDVSRPGSPAILAALQGIEDRLTRIDPSGGRLRGALGFGLHMRPGELPRFSGLLDAAALRDVMVIPQRPGLTPLAELSRLELDAQIARPHDPAQLPGIPTTPDPSR